MAKAFFTFGNISLKNSYSGGWVAVQGDITNNSNKDFHTTVFRFSAFDKSVILWTGIIKIPGFRKGQTRSFELTMEGMRQETASSVARHEIYFEGGY
ncbi:MAG: FxLYD domain-containing protein [Candidatus Omnitrophica bacterium]|nr:FxLYD domain-containing protein [Candidatus Omnitrophota bacterium]